MESEFAKPLDEIQDQQRSLASHLSAFLSHELSDEISIDQSKDLLLQFFDANTMQVLLDSSLSVEAADVSNSRAVSAVAKFVTSTIHQETADANALQDVLEGLVVQDALTLERISFPDRPFRRLRIYFDTTFLLSLFGFEGRPAELLAAESVRILKEAGASLFVFSATLEEIRGILRLYAEKLLTSEGRMSLRPTAMTRHVLSTHMTSSDMRERIACLEDDISKWARVEPFPRTDRRFNIDHTGLSEVLRHHLGEIDDPRVVHDVGCIAAVVTLRGAQHPSRVEEVNAIFATNTVKVVRNVTSWFQQEYPREFSPAVGVSDLVREAWKRKPQIGRNLPRAQMAAVCAAAVRPSREVWECFQNHLRRMADEGKISTDGQAAILASELTDQLLSDTFYDHDPDASSVLEALDRVKRDAEQELAKQYESKLDAEREARRDAENMAAEIHAELRIANQRAEVGEDQARIAVGLLATVVMKSLRVFVFLAYAALLLAGAFALPENAPMWSKYLGFSSVVIAIVLTAWSEAYGQSPIASALSGVRSWVKRRISRLVEGKRGDRTDAEVDPGKAPGT